MPKLDWKVHGMDHGRDVMKRVFAAAFGLTLVAASAAFAQRPDRNVELPIVRSFHWFDYVGGDDIRPACACRMSISGGRSPHAVTAYGAFRHTIIRPTVSQT